VSAFDGAILKNLFTTKWKKVKFIA
jgi:hypothetical protein